MEPLGQGRCSPRPCRGFRVEPSQPDLEAFQRLPPQGLRVAGRWGRHLGAERAISLPQTSQLFPSGQILGGEERELRSHPRKVTQAGSYSEAAHPWPLPDDPNPEPAKRQGRRRQRQRARELLLPGSPGPIWPSRCSLSRSPVPVGLWLV